MATEVPAQAAERTPARESESAVERFFHIRERGSSVGTEVRGGLTTFIVMAYILFVNPTILSTLTQGKGPDFASTVTMTALAAGFDKHLTKPVGVGTLEQLLRSRAEGSAFRAPPQ